jgi:hypothetical protein
VLGETGSPGDWSIGQVVAYYDGGPYAVLGTDMGSFSVMDSIPVAACTAPDGWTVGSLVGLRHGAEVWQGQSRQGSPFVVSDTAREPYSVKVVDGPQCVADEVWMGISRRAVDSAGGGTGWVVPSQAVYVGTVNVRDEAGFWRAALNALPGGSIGPIAGYPGSILVPPRNSLLLDGLELRTASWKSIFTDRSGNSNSYPRYGFSVADAQRSGFIDFTGSPGSGRYKAERDYYQAALSRCPSAPTYCAVGGSVPQELFFDLHVSGQPAHAVHYNRSGAMWAISWYRPDLDTNYAIALGGAVADDFSNPEADGAHILNAHWLTNFAESLIPITVNP